MVPAPFIGYIVFANFSAEFQKYFSFLDSVPLFSSSPQSSFQQTRDIMGISNLTNQLFLNDTYVIAHNVATKAPPHTYTRHDGSGGRIWGKSLRMISRHGRERMKSGRRERRSERESTLINILKFSLVTEGLTALRKQSGNVTVDVTEWRLSAFRGSLSEKKICPSVGGWGRGVYWVKRVEFM